MIGVNSVWDTFVQNWRSLEYLLYLEGGGNTEPQIRCDGWLLQDALKRKKAHILLHHKHLMYTVSLLLCSSYSIITKALLWHLYVLYSVLQNFPEFHLREWKDNNGWLHFNLNRHEIKTKAAWRRNYSKNTCKFLLITNRLNMHNTDVLPDNTKCAIADRAVWLHLCRAGHLAGRVAVRLRHGSSAAGASSESCGVARGSSRRGWSGKARCSAKARGRGSAGGVDTEILVTQLGARKQVAAHRLPACAVKCHRPLP